jgi:hypothetical protein
MMNIPADNRDNGTFTRQLESIHYANPELESNWEVQEVNHYAYPEVTNELEDEGEYFFKNAWRGVQQVAKVAVPLAKQLAPVVARTLVGAIPGAEAVGGPLAGSLILQLLQEGEMEAVSMEAQFFGTNEAELEVGNTEAAQEAALTEVLAAEASHSERESEAGALLGAAVPSAVKSMGGAQALRHIMPVLIQATARLVRLLHRRGPAGRHLLRLVPTVLRRTVASLRAAQQAGRPITSALAVRLMAAQAARVLGNSTMVTRTMLRNAIIRKYTVAPSGAMSA